VAADYLIRVVSSHRVVVRAASAKDAECILKARERDLNATEDLLKPAQIRNEGLRIYHACVKRQATVVKHPTREKE
jgi:hypothetical protein